MQPLTFNEYLTLEEKARRKHELVDGVLYAMAGATRNHNLITVNLATLLRPAAREKGCRLFASDMKLRVGERTAYYPDLMLVCGPSPKSPLYEDSPCLVVEILSASTERQDRGEKRLAYQGLSTLQAYLLVDARRRRVEGYYRQNEQWLYQDIQGAGEFEVPCLGLSLSLDAVYEGTDVPSIDNPNDHG